MAEKTEKKKGAGKGEKAPEPKTEAAAAPGERCRVAKCKQPVRAKGYCRKHYLGWRRGELGTKHRYKTCSTEGCRKPVVLAGKCEEHKRGATAAQAASA